MKKLFLFLTLFISVFLFGKSTSAQTIKLDSIIGFPDTVYAGESKTMDLLISNSGGFLFNADLVVLMHSLGDSSGVDTLYYNPAYVISGNTFYDTLHITHTFEASELDGGDNIVVVWPASSQMPLAVSNDSLYFNVYFINVGIEEHNNAQSFLLFPGSSGGRMELQIAHPEKVEQVRVFDIMGVEVLRFKGPVTGFNTGSCSSGIYFVEVMNSDHSTVIKKFFKD